MSDNNTKLIIGTALAVGTITAASLAYLYTKKVEEPIPNKWKKVGEITDLKFYPMKSCAPIKHQSFNCHVLGFEHESLFDRCFVVSRNDKQVTARAHPRMVLIRPTIIGDQLTLSAPGKPDFVLNLNEVRKRPVKKRVQLWQSTINGIDAGDEVADWLSEYLVDRPGVFRLLFYPYLYPTKGFRKTDRGRFFYKDEDVGAYHDMTSYMLINQASVDEMNSHLDHVVKPLQFRPNIVVKGPGAYEEDHWKWIRFGENVVFRGIRPCQRCIFIVIDPETAERHPQREPLETLKKRRELIPNRPPVMGLHLAIQVPGSISIGDGVYIGESKV